MFQGEFQSRDNYLSSQQEQQEWIMLNNVEDQTSSSTRKQTNTVGFRESDSLITDENKDNPIIDEELLQELLNNDTAKSSIIVQSQYDTTVTEFSKGPS